MTSYTANGDTNGNTRARLRSMQSRLEAFHDDDLRLIDEAMMVVAIVRIERAIPRSAQHAFAALLALVEERDARIAEIESDETPPYPEGES